MVIRRVALTDHVTLGDGVTSKDGVTGYRHLSPESVFSGFLLLENGDNLLEEDGDELLSEQFEDGD
jgi:hypothetical protein